MLARIRSDTCRMNASPPSSARPVATAHGLARTLSKRGLCSRSRAEALIRAGRVRVDGRIVRDPEARTLDGAKITLDEAELESAPLRYLMLNKPRGLVTTTADERGRDTVYSLFADADLPWLAPVGRLDKASEGLLLFTNDSAWAARITAPESRVGKTYHVQIGALPDATLLARLRDGVDSTVGHLALDSVRELRRGAKNAWLEIVLDEGRNRHIRRMLEALDVPVLRLIRVAIGSLALGDLPKGHWRDLSADEASILCENRDVPVESTRA